MKIIYIGSSGALSSIPLRRLIDSAFKPTAIMIESQSVPDSAYRPLINSVSDPIEKLAFYNNIPLIRFTEADSNQLTALQAFQPDIILVSCFSRKVPDPFFSIPRIGCYNLHPSLLPAYRGPVPLFWQLRKGEKNLGVTLHRLSSEFDKGNIVAQKKVTLPDGLSHKEATTILAETAAELILKTVASFLNKSPDEIKSNEISQNEKFASYFSYPDESDYEVSVSWTAKRMYNFIAAYQEPGRTFKLSLKGECFKLIQVYSYESNVSAELEGKSFVLKEDQLLLKCQNGMIRCQILL